MTSSPMKEAAETAGLAYDQYGTVALDRMDRWAGQVAAALHSAPGSLIGIRAVAREHGVEQEEVAADLAYDVAEALELERTRVDVADCVARCAYDMAEALERERTWRINRDD